MQLHVILLCLKWNKYKLDTREKEKGKLINIDNPTIKNKCEFFVVKLLYKKKLFVVL